MGKVQSGDACWRSEVAVYTDHSELEDELCS